jgi:ATP-dependent DNA ligase
MCESCFERCRHVSDDRRCVVGGARLARADGAWSGCWTRTGLDWTHKYQSIAAAVAPLPARQAYLDGELCGVRPDGRRLRSRLKPDRRD